MPFFLCPIPQQPGGLFWTREAQKVEKTEWRWTLRRASQWRRNYFEEGACRPHFSKPTTSRGTVRVFSFLLPAVCFGQQFDHGRVVPVVSLGKGGHGLGREESSHMFLIYAVDSIQYAIFNIIDMEMLYFSADAHIRSVGGSGDCLHLRIPGPLDLFPVLVHHSFLEHHGYSASTVG